MRPQMLPLGAGAMSRSDVRRFTMVALQAWRAITLRQWVWTTAIALLLLLAYVIGLLPPLLNLVPAARLRMVQPSGSSHGALYLYGGFVVTYLAAAYCFLLAISIAEAGAGQLLVPRLRYVASGFAACSVAVLLEIMLYALVPSLAPVAGFGGWALVSDPQVLLSRMAWSAANFGLSGGLALAVYVRFRSARLAREAFNATELERVAAGREVLASRLAAMQARVEPGFLLGTLAQVEALYERDPQAGDRMLDGLIAYLHAALPQLRSPRSTLMQEVQLVESYLSIVQIRMGSRLDCRVNVRPELGDCDFPPMVLLPLVDDALRNGLEPLPLGGTIAITADLDGDCVRVRVSDDGLPRTAAMDESFAITALHERLRGLYGTTARLEFTANAPQGVIAAIEVPLATTRNHR